MRRNRLRYAFLFTCTALRRCPPISGGFRSATASCREEFIAFPGAPERGDPVSFCLQNTSFAPLALDRGYLRPGTCPGGLQPLFKVVAGVPGDDVALAPDGIRINGRLQPDSRACGKDSHGRSLPPVALHPGRIPSGMALVLSDDHPGGFDSRYFGLVPLDSLQQVKPIKLF